MKRGWLAALALGAALPAQAQHAAPPDGPVAGGTIEQRVAAILATAPAGTRIGLLVVDDAGREVIAVQPDARFVPASSTKLFTTAAAFALFDRMGEAGEAPGATKLTLRSRPKGAPDLVLRGEGGVSLSSAPDCVTRCLISLATQVVQRTRKVHDIVIDASAFPGPAWSLGMSWNNIGTPSGTALSAVMVDDNVSAITISPTTPGKPPLVAVPSYFRVINQAQTLAEGATRLGIERRVNSREIRVSGTVPIGATPWRARLGIDDPSDYAGWALAQALAAAGVRVEGRVRVLDGPVAATDAGLEPAASIAAVPLDEEVARINKDSQNVHAEALLRRLGIVAARVTFSDGGNGVQPGSREAGLEAMRAALEPAKLPAGGLELHDGSGMSSYNRMSPRAAVSLLRWAAAQPWGDRFAASLALAGRDGTLRNRFRDTPLDGRLIGKTGSLQATTALSGYLTTPRGTRLIFSLIANDVPDGANAAPVLDQVLVALAEGNP